MLRDPGSRERLFDRLASGGIGDVVVLTGDAHSSWAIDLARDPFAPEAYDPASGRGVLAVELVTPGVTSPSDLDAGRAARNAARVVAQHPHIHWVDLHHRGYVVLDLDAERAQADWWFVDGVAERRLEERFARGWTSARGESHLVEASAPAPDDPAAPAPAP